MWDNAHHALTLSQPTKTMAEYANQEKSEEKLQRDFLLDNPENWANL
jgi:hypothetical protein